MEPIAPPIAQPWSPNKRQEQFIRIPLTVFEAFYGGAVGGGKTEILLLLPILYDLISKPRFKGFFLRRTVKELDNEVIPRSHIYYPSTGGIYNESKKRWQWPCGAFIQFGHVEHPKDVHKYDTVEISYLAIDEASHFEEAVYLYLAMTRVRSSVAGMPAIVRLASNPGGIGHQWIKERFIDPAEQGGILIRDKKTGSKRIFIRAYATDNPHLLKHDPEYLSHLELLPEAEKKAKLYGDWSAYEGQVFRELRTDRIETEPENAYHLVKPFEVPGYWPKIVAIDWGFTAYTSVGYGAISPDKKLYVYRHQAWKERKIEEWGPLVKYFTDKEKPEDIVICHSANQRRGDPHTIQEQISEVLEDAVRLGERDRVGGKQLIHEYLRWEVAPRNDSQKSEYDPEFALWLYRNKGPDIYNEYMRQYDDNYDESKEIPKLLFFDEPEVLRITDCLKACVYDKNRVEDVAEFKGDDFYDMMRMLVYSADRYFEQSAEEHERVVKKAEFIQQFEAAEDKVVAMTNLHRMAPQLDRPVKAVRRNGPLGRKPGWVNLPFWSSK